MESADKLKDLIPVLLFLLPGFVSAGIVEMLVVRKSKDTFGRIVEALIFTVFNLVVFTVFRSLLEHIPLLRFDHSNFFTAGNTLLMTACALGIGLLWSAELTNEVLLGRLRNLKITEKTAKASTWGETFVNSKKFVVVHLEDGRRIYGWPTFYSDDPAERALYLEDASWLGSENNLLNDPPISIFVDNNSGIKLIEFVDFH